MKKNLVKEQVTRDLKKESELIFHQMATYQTYLYKVVIEDFELGWQIDENRTVLFNSNEYDTPSHTIQELNFLEPAHNK